LVLAAKDTEFDHNTVTSNESAGALFASCATLNAVAGSQILPCDTTGYNGYTKGGYIHDNTFTTNALTPQDFLAVEATPGFTMYWDSALDPADPTPVSDDNKLCIQTNTDDASSGHSYGSLGGDMLSDHDCTHTSQTPIAVTWGAEP